jgi:hypothetical protein
MTTKDFICSILPVLLVIIDIASAGVFVYYREWPYVMYWLAAAMITGATIWMRL